MSVKTEAEAIDFVVGKYAFKLRRRGPPAGGIRNQGLTSDDDQALERILREACEELAFELRPG